MSQFPPGAMVRASQVYSKPGRPGLLPISQSTFYDWLATGRVPQGKRIGNRTVVWPVDALLDIGGTKPAQGAQA